MCLIYFLVLNSPQVNINAFILDFKKPIAPGHPLYAQFNSNNGNPFSTMFIYHEKRESEWEKIDLKVNDSGVKL